MNRARLTDSNSLTAAKYIREGHRVRQYNSVNGHPVRVIAVDRFDGFVQVFTSDNDMIQYREDDKVFRIIRSPRGRG